MMTKQLKIRGRVQGVGFRYAMCDVAQSMGLKGWVKNVSDGTVEAIVQGEKELVESIIDWTQKGPPGAHVEKVEISDGAGKFDDFDIHPTWS
jgi:acylphosphatase